VIVFINPFAGQDYALIEFYLRLIKESWKKEGKLGYC
jgi:hypothetical protein